MGLLYLYIDTDIYSRLPVCWNELSKDPLSRYKRPFLKTRQVIKPSFIYSLCYVGCAIRQLPIVFMHYWLGVTEYLSQGCQNGVETCGICPHHCAIRSYTCSAAEPKFQRFACFALFIPHWYCSNYQHLVCGGKPGVKRSLGRCKRRW